MDPRITQLAEQLITYSVKLQPGEKIYIEIKGLEAMELGKELVRVATVHGGVPFWYYNDETLSRGFVKNAGEDQFAAWGEFHAPIMESVDAYIGVRGLGLVLSGGRSVYGLPDDFRGVAILEPLGVPLLAILLVLTYLVFSRVFPTLPLPNRS